MKCVKLLLIATVLVLFAGCSSDLYEGAVEGIKVVLTAADGPTPVYDATVKVEGETEYFSAGKRSSVDGTATFKGMPDDDYSLEAESKNGVLFGKMRVRVADGRSAGGLYFQVNTRAEGSRVAMVDGTYDRIGDTMERLGYLYATVSAGDLADPATFETTDMLILNSGCDAGPAADPAAIENIRTFVEGGGRLVVSGRANAYIDAVWPGAISYLGLDVTGVGLQETRANFDDADMKTCMLGNSIKITYKIGGFPVMTGTTGKVLASGDVAYPGGTAAGAPLAVGLSYGSGSVTYTNFAWSEQDDPGDAARRLFNYVIANR